MRYCHLLWVISLSLLVSFAQEPSANHTVMGPGYILGPDDQFVIHGVEIEEIAEKPVQVGQDGNITLPLVGSIQAAGMTIGEFQAALNAKLSKFIQTPQFSITVTEFRSQPVSVLGAVNTAGVQQLRGVRNLTEVLSMAGGVRADAGYQIHIVRKLEWGTIPLPNAHADESGQFSVAEVNLKDILDAKSPQENIRIFPEDVITVPRAQLVYVVGRVPKSGGFILNEHESMTVLQALALAGGLEITASAKNAKLLRPVNGGTTKIEVPVDLAKILAGKMPDLPMKAEDILFIPNSLAKSAGLRAAEMAIQVGTGLVIWR
jgi:polysaccharide biosynthesis/export protein